MARRRRSVVAAAVMSLVLAACGAPGATFAGISTGDVTSTGGFARSVPIGNGRSIFLECRGSGSPTVVLVSGTGGASDEWALAVDPTDPAARPRPSASAVLPTVASFTRVCAHDRPGTTRNDGRPSPSTRVSQPTTAEDGARDLRAVLAAAGERRPYVIVGASWGAMIALLLARTDSPQVAGLVTVDGASEFLKKELSPAQWSGWMHKIEAMDAADGREVPDYESSVHELRAAPAMPRPLPAVVLTSDKPWDLQVEGTGSTWPAWLAAQDRLAAELCARHITDTRSGHGIGVEQPQMVSTAIREVVDEARNKP